MTQGINKQIGTLAAIESKFHFFKVGRKMLGANPVPRSHDAALEKRKGGFDGIGMNVSHDVHAGTVVNLFMVHSFCFPHGGIIRGCIIGENDFHVLTDILADILRERSTFGISGMEEAQIAVALANADHYFLVVESYDMSFPFDLAANVGNVHLYFAVEHGLIGLRHCVTDTMAEVPRRLVAHSDCALNLAGRHSLLRFAEQVCGKKPFSKRQMRIVEYGAGSDGELVIAVFAVEKLLVGIQLDHGAFATQAARAFGEAETN